MGKDNDRGFKVITAFIKPGFRLRFSPTIIGAENIPKDGAVVIAGNASILTVRSPRFSDGRAAYPSTATASMPPRSEAR